MNCRSLSLALALWLGGAVPSFAQSTSPAWMRGLDEIMSLEVTSVSRKEQRVADTSAAVFVLTRDDIRRSGVRTVAELLRLVPGLHVAQIDGNKWAVSSRGMSSRWSKNLQVMIDGRSIYTPYFASVYWDAVDIPVQAIERIEVVRGPGASIWGANAVNGVINIITMGAATRRETTVSAGGGSTDFGAVLHEGRIGDRIGYRLFGDASTYDEMLVAGGRGAQDDWMQRRGGGSLQATLNTRDVFEASFRMSDSHASSPHMTVTSMVPFQSGFVPFRSDAESWAASARWTRQLTGTGHLQVDGFVDEWRRDDDLDHFRRTANLSVQHRVGGLGRHDLMWGGELRYTHDITKGTRFIGVSPDHYDHKLASAFAQDEIAVAGDRVHVTLGGKVEHRDYTGLSFQPTARVHWRVTPQHAVWAAVSRAERAPDRIERSLRLLIAGFPAGNGLSAVMGLQGNPEIAPEWMTSYEAGYRTVLRDTVTVDLAAYVSRYSNLMATVPGPPEMEFEDAQPYLYIPREYNNLVDATTAGGEAVVTYVPSERWKLSASYSLFSIDPAYTAPATADTFGGLNFPKQNAVIRSSLAVTPEIDVDTTLFAVGGLHASSVAAYTRVDNRLAWRPRSDVELSIAVQNLLDRRHVEFDSPTSVVVEPSQVPRTLYGAVTWRF